MKRPKSIFLLPENTYRMIYSDAIIGELCRLTENAGRVSDAASILAAPEKFAEIEIVFSGWGAPHMSPELLDALPRLKALLYGAGSVRAMVNEHFWQRGIRLTSAYQANAVPVAEYTVASIIFCLKKAFQFSRALHDGGKGGQGLEIPGVYLGSKVGVISLGAIGQLVCRKLKEFDLDVVAYDPFASDAVFTECAAKKVVSLEQIFSECDVVTLHAPWLPETEGMITGELLRRMPKGAAFINTSRGAVVAEAEMIEVLEERADLFAVIDVITKEPGYEKSPLARLPNVFLTPHIAGSKGRECHRMGRFVLEECQRFLANEPARTPVTRENIARMA